jgi:hypothetical protein
MDRIAKDCLKYIAAVHTTHTHDTHCRFLCACRAGARHETSESSDLMQGLKVDPGKLSSLAEDFPLADRSGHSVSFLHVFKYSSTEAGHVVMPCPPHTDSGLVTVIPCAQAPGLEILVQSHSLVCRCRHRRVVCLTWSGAAVADLGLGDVTMAQRRGGGRQLSDRLRSARGRDAGSAHLRPAPGIRAPRRTYPLPAHCLCVVHTDVDVGEGCNQQRSRPDLVDGEAQSAWTRYSLPFQLRGRLDAVIDSVALASPLVPDPPEHLRHPVTVRDFIAQSPALVCVPRVFPCVCRVCHVRAGLTTMSVSFRCGRGVEQVT